MKKLLSLIFFFITIIRAFADFGVVLSEGLLAERNDETATASKTTLSPWLSLPLGGADFYLSAGVSAEYEDGFSFFPELHNLELSLRLPVSSPATSSTGAQSRFGARLGRISWQDPSMLTAGGYFDGLDIFTELGSIRLGATAFYTGFLHKNTAYVNMSPGDPKDYSDDFDWADFDTYFAPRRFITSLYGDFSGIPHGRGDIQAGILAQFDFSGAEEAFNTQYLLLRYIFYYKNFDMTAAGAMEFENTEANGFRTAYAFFAEGAWQTGLLRDRLSIGFRWASGEGAYTAAFFPLIREAQGAVLRPILSGIMALHIHYQVRLLPSLSAQLEGRYFIRTDGSSFDDPYLEHDSYFIGAEAAGALQWVPLSDLSFSLSGGVFLPKTGTAMADNAPLRWSINMTTIFSF